MTNPQNDPDGLRSIQHWFQSVIMEPPGSLKGSSDGAMQDEIGQVILPSVEMTSSDRVQIYQRAYFGRLLECLRTQFPAMQYAIGTEAFDGLAFGYLSENPSRNYSLSSLGESFESYLASTRPPRDEQADPSEPDFADFLIDLARLERLYGEVFDGPGPERSSSLNRDDLRGLTPEQFAESSLRFHESVRLEQFRFPVHEYVTAIRRGLEPVPPESRTVYLVITRRDYIVRRFEVTALHYELLSHLKSNPTLGIGNSLKEMMKKVNSTDLDDWAQSFKAADIHDWFKFWTSAPLFAELIHKQG